MPTLAWACSFSAFIACSRQREHATRPPTWFRLHPLQTGHAKARRSSVGCPIRLTDECGPIRNRRPETDWSTGITRRRVERPRCKVTPLRGSRPFTRSVTASRSRCDATAVEAFSKVRLSQKLTSAKYSSRSASARLSLRSPSWCMRCTTGAGISESDSRRSAESEPSNALQGWGATSIEAGVQFHPSNGRISLIA